MADEIQMQIQRVNAAQQAWDRSQDEFERPAWLLYQAERDKLDAMLAWARVAKKEAVSA